MCKVTSQYIPDSPDCVTIKLRNRVKAGQRGTGNTPVETIKRAMDFCPYFGGVQCYSSDWNRPKGSRLSWEHYLRKTYIYRVFHAM